MLKGYKFEIFPSDSQKELIHKTIGCNRLVYNLMLDKKIKLYEKKGKSLSKFDVNNRLVQLKKKNIHSLTKLIQGLYFVPQSI